jgi:hypothetical protein
MQMITVLGSINIDLVARTRRLPRPGETVAGRSANTAAGGKGANQALAVHRISQRIERTKRSRRQPSSFTDAKTVLASLTIETCE